MKNQLMTIIVLSMLFCVACKKNNLDKSKFIVETKMNVFAGSLEGPANPLNPYDSAGYFHNVVLAGIMKQVDLKKDSSLDFIHAAAIEAAQGIGVHMNEKNKAAALAISKDVSNKFANVISTMPCSNQAKNWLQKLVIALTQTSGVSSEVYPILKSRITNLEKDILADRSLTENERFIVLGATSVGRYSLLFWSTQYNPDVDTTPAARPFNLLRFICVGLADVFGFAFNAAVGGDGTGLAGAAAAGAEASADGNASLNYIPGNSIFD